MRGGVPLAPYRPFSPFRECGCIAARRLTVRCGRRDQHARTPTTRGIWEGGKCGAETHTAQCGLDMRTHKAQGSGPRVRRVPRGVSHRDFSFFPLFELMVFAMGDLCVERASSACLSNTWKCPENQWLGKCLHG